jgi:hypothetical protein
MILRRITEHVRSGASRRNITRPARDIRATIRDMAANAPDAQPGTFRERLYMTRDERSRGRCPQPALFSSHANRRP